MTVYDIFFFVFSIIYLPYLVLKGKAHKDFGERLGKLPPIFKEMRRSKPVWIHAVSVGEVMAVKNFTEGLLKRFPGKKIVLSTTTKTGNAIAKKVLNKDILKFYFPLDFSFIVRRVANIVNPSLLLIMETELWPNLILELSRRRVPVVIINGRLSERSYSGYRKIGFLFGKILKRISLFCMQAQEDAERIVKLGADPASVKVTGNMKFDLADFTNEARTFTDLQGVLQHTLEVCKGELIIAGSTHKGEEEIILEVYERLLKEFPDIKLLIAPRHIDRAPRIKKLALRMGFGEKAVSVLDTHGELSRLYGFATIVFMGGSLTKRGGHNIVEPARFGKPIIFGPFMFNFRDMARSFLKNNAAIEVKDKKELFESVKTLLRDKGKRDILGGNAKKIIDKNKGATEKNINELELVMGTFCNEKYFR